MSSTGGNVLSALKARLLTIQETAGYSVSIKSVILDASVPTLNLPAMDLPAIEIMNLAESYDHSASAHYVASMDVILSMIAEKAWTDSQMEDFKRDVIRALYGGASDASGNTGVTLGGTVAGIELVDAQGDLNMIESNRVYLLRVRLRSHRTTYRGG